MNGTLVLLLIIGIGIYYYLKKRRKREIKSINDHIEKGVIKDVEEVKRYGKEAGSDIRKNKYEIYYRKYKYSELNLNTLDYILKEKCAESYGCKHISSYEIKNIRVRLTNVYKFISDPFSKLSGGSSVVNTFTYMREIPDDEYYKYRESFENTHNQVEYVDINCMLGYTVQTMPSGPEQVIYIFYFSQVDEGKRQSFNF